MGGGHSLEVDVGKFGRLVKISLYRALCHTTIGRGSSDEEVFLSLSNSGLGFFRVNTVHFRNTELRTIFNYSDINVMFKKITGSERSTKVDLFYVTVRGNDFCCWISYVDLDCISRSVLCG